MVRASRIVGAGVALALTGCGGGDAAEPPGATSTERSSTSVSTTEVGDLAEDVAPSDTPGGSDPSAPTVASAPAETSAPTGMTPPSGSPDVDRPPDSDFLESLDGFVVFSSERDDGPEQSSDDLYQMNADGSNVRRLTDTDRNEWWPHVSAGGDELVFGRNYPTESRAVPSGHSAWGVWLWSSSGDPVDLTDNSQFQAGPRMSPDGSRILLTSARGSSASFDDDNLYTMGDTNVWSMARDGSDAVQLTDGGGSAGSWSPTGDEVVFSARHDGRNDSDIFVADADGTNPRALTDAPSNESRPDWSPDGARIVFDSDRDGDREIFVVAVDGSGLRQLTDNDSDDDFARWSPTGDGIVFTADRDGNSEIYVMADDGSNQTNISNDEAFDAFPSWASAPFG